LQEQIMNKNQNDCPEPSDTKTNGSSDREGHGTAGRHGRRERAAETSNLRRNDRLTREAKRLLTALGLPEARALPDPTDEKGLILHRRRAGISVGAGRFSRAAGDALQHHDLARWEAAEAGSRALCLTEAGRAHLRRSGAPERETAFLHQHRDTQGANVETGAGTARVRVDREESPLEWLRRRKGRDGQPLIDEASFQAGERLRTDITLAGLLPGVVARWDALPRAPGPVAPSDATDRMVAARQRLRHAFDAVGADFADLLTDLCGFLKGLETIERERHWPPRSAKVVVRLALARLAQHYGIQAEARGPSASRGIQAWQAVVIDGGRS
jgi:hypothetical protein